MRKEITLKQLVDYLDKKSSEIEGESILTQLDRIESTIDISTTEILNKMYDMGFKIKILLAATKPCLCR